MTTLIPALAFIASTCLWTECELSGGLGAQYEYAITNDYGRMVGELRLQSEWGPFYGACIHISGINTPEPDGGLNYCSTGFRVRF